MSTKYTQKLYEDKIVNKNDSNSIQLAFGKTLELKTPDEIISETFSDDCCCDDCCEHEHEDEHVEEATEQVIAQEEVEEIAAPVAEEVPEEVPEETPVEKPVVSLKSSPKLTLASAYAAKPNSCPDCGSKLTTVNETYPTCTADGHTEYKYCKNCGYTSDYDIKPAGHKWNNGTITTYATCLEPGVMTYECVRYGCNETKTEPIQATGHDFRVLKNKSKSPTCGEDGYNCFLGGNIGTPLFTKIKDMQPEDIVVLELSSFQLMNMKVSPKIAVITNITPNHLNIHADMEEYVEAKKNIFKYQDKDDLVILNYDNEITRKCSEEAPGKVMFFSSKDKNVNGYLVDTDDGKIKVSENGLRKHVFDTKNMKLRGVHNFENASCAIIATKDLVKKESIDKVLTEFKGVEHRLELVKETKNIFINNIYAV